jgi:hypothetical protein
LSLTRIATVSSLDACPVAAPAEGVFRSPSETRTDSTVGDTLDKLQLQPLKFQLDVLPAAFPAGHPPEVPLHQAMIAEITFPEFSTEQIAVIV